jgi:small-conductance mechanosensitive channel
MKKKILSFILSMIWGQRKRNMGKISFWIITALALFGTLMLVIITHELVHKFDFKPILEKNSKEEICVLNLPTSFKDLKNASVGYYKFYSDDNKKEEYEKIEKHAELRAYFISLIIWVIFGFALIAFFRERLEIEDRLKSFGINPNEI